MTIDEELASLGAIVVEDRVLRRVIKQHRRLPGLGLQVPHAESYTLARATLEKLIDRKRELAIDPATLPERAILIRGDRAKLAAADPRALSDAWRAIFHGRIHQAFEDLILANKLTATLVRERINRIGQTEFDEVRYLLRQEDLLLPPADDLAAYTEFVALFLELRHFDPHSLERTFSTLHDAAPVMATIALDLDPAALLASARPPSAPAEPILPAQAAPRERAPEREAVVDRSVTAAAARARKRGNDARAAILAFRAGDLDTAERDLARLIERLAKALADADGPAPTEGWLAALFPVVRAAAGDQQLRFTPITRLFADLQAACVVAEREVRVIDVLGWATSLGKRPISRPLPATREVRIAKKVHAAAKKLPAVTLATREERERLADVLHAMTERAERGVRTVLRPAIERALDEVELHPQNLPEQVAEKKIVDELLDHAVTVGRLTFSHLRDAVANNELKLPDLRREPIVYDDQLLRADRALAHSLDGVYRRGEVYMRFLQKLSSVLFATKLGRLLCLYLLLPAIGSYAALEGAQHIVGPLTHLITGVHPEIATPPAFLGLGVYLFLLLHVPPVRTYSWAGLRLFGRGLAFVLFRGPALLLRVPAIRDFLDGPIGRMLVRPGLAGGLIWLLLWRVEDLPRALIAAGAFVVSFAINNTRTGRHAQELALDGAVRSSRQIAHRLVPGLIVAFLEIFGRAIELVDRGLYRVDEALRFRTGASLVSKLVKGTLGVFWFAITYFLRIALNVFIEPVVNPVKHFPTVTVAGKLLVPFYQGIAAGVTDAVSPLLGRGIGGVLAGFSILMVPGFAGFLVWELKTNWKLYAANRSSTLRPAAFGHHGETVTRFLKPGFHSGTIPKLFAKVRRATWKGDERGIARAEEALHHVAESFETFVDRELVSLLVACKPFRITDVEVVHVELAANRLRVELACPSLAHEHAIIAFEQQSGYIVAGFVELGWLVRLDEAQRGIFEVALAGFYKLAAVDLVREQLVAVVGGAPYDISDDGLVVWPGDDYTTELLYDLRAQNLAPVVRGPTAGIETPSFIHRHALYFREVLRWPTWALTWEELVRGGAPARIVAGPDLVPVPATPATAAA